MQVSMNELAAIGDLTLTWNSVEEHLQWLIWAMAGWDKPVGEVVTTDMGNVARVQLALNLANLHLDENYLAEVQVVMAFVDICRSRRNSIIHGIPSREPNEPKTLKAFSAKAGKGMVRATSTPFDVVSLQTLIQDMMRLMVALTYLQKRTEGRLPKSKPSDYFEAASACIGPIRKRLSDLRHQSQPSGNNLPPPQSFPE